MEAEVYNIWYDPNEVDADNRTQVLRAWARPGLEIAIGDTILLGDDELDPVPARILSFDADTGILTVELLSDATHIAVA
jgi:hypothetical protein